MAKYSDDQLRIRARTLINAKDKGDSRAEMVLMMLSVTTGMSYDQCLARIEEYAKEAKPCYAD